VLDPYDRLVRLSFEQGRVVGSLIEKQLTTPQQYPLTLNSLVLACNQTSNRDPVVSYEDGLVQRALATLKEIGVVRFVYPSSGRSATRYRQVIGEALGLDERSLALVAVLLLRGPQTVGELRTRTERMTTFDDLGAVNTELERLADRAEPHVLRLHQKEERWVQLLTPDAATIDHTGGAGGEASISARDEGFVPTSGDTSRKSEDEEHSANDFGTLADEVAALREEVAELRVAVGQLRAELSEEGGIAS
jgi:uncharacterized protein YceH (UPF0502 family)